MKSDRTQNASGALQKIGKQGNCAEAFAGLPVLSHFTKGFWQGQHEFANALTITVFNILPNSMWGSKINETGGESERDEAG